MTLQEYIASLRGKTVAVIGIGVSNTPLLRRLLAEGIAVTACDRSDRAKLGALAEELEAAGAKLQLGDGYLQNLSQDVIFRTPGLRPDVPELEAARAKGSTITSEMEVFFEVCPCPIIAVTGSDGKTTTTTIIAQLLRAAGHTVHVGGNIGHPLLAEAGSIRPTDWAVLELSSFQLMTMTRSPHIAVLTNLAPNHLDVHKSMEEYIWAKENIFRHQQPGDIAVFNLDNAITRELSAHAPGRALYFSRREEPENGVFLRGNAVISRRDGRERQIMTTEDIRLPGVHNVENYMAAICAVEGLVSDEVIREFARTFGGVEHRIELIRTRKGVRWYNDSIASSPTRTIAGLRSFNQKIILIAGGYDKKIPYEPLAPEILAHVKTLVLMGATGPRIEAAVRACPGFDESALTILHADSMQHAVELARGAAQPGDVVSLSPASASFDLYPNFEVRGRDYKNIVNNLK